MIKIINISNREKAIKQLEVFKQKRYENYDIKFENVGLREINELLDLKLFTKNDLYIYASTLFDLMSETKHSSSHNCHNLTPEDILDALVNIRKPLAIILVKFGRLSIVTRIASHFGIPLLFIIELNSGLFVNPIAKINKIVTIYPKDDIDKYLSHFDKKEIIYRK